MKKELVIYRVKARTPEWFEARRKLGIGASEAAATLMPSMHEYLSGIRVFYEKVGMVPHRLETNEFAFWGITDEEKIAEAWEYWDGTLDENKNPGYIHNFQIMNKIRRCRRVNGIVQNPKYPWLYMSPDRLINKDQPSLDENLLLKGPMLENECPLEVKTISRYSVNKWKIKIPIYYLIQVTIQMMVLEVDYAEMAIREDGNRLRVERIPFMPELANQIAEQTRNFWDRVIEAKRHYTNMLMTNNEREREILLAKIHELEPPNDGSEDYKQFFSDTFNAEIEQIPGENEDLVNAFRAKLMTTIMKQAEKQKLYFENNLRTRCNQNSASRIDLGPAGYIKFFKKEGNANYQLYNGLKTDFDESEIIRIIHENFTNKFNS